VVPRQSQATRAGEATASLEESARSGIRRRRYAIIQVAAYECKQKELAMRRVKQEVIDLDDD
jgi:hypothetical protein